MKEIWICVVSMALIILFSQCTGNVQDELNKYVETENARYPLKVDDFTRLDSCTALPNKTLRYYYTALVDKSILDTAAMKTTIHPSLISDIRLDTGTAYFRKNDVTFQYRYNDGYGNYVCQINITPQDYK